MYMGLQKRLYSLEWKDIRGDLLGDEERLRFRSFLDEFVRDRGKSVIYRGNAELRSQYGVGTENMYMLASYIFMLGEKGRYFVENAPVFPIDAGGHDIFRYIWDRMHKKVCNVQSFSCAGTRRHVSAFLDSNDGFYDFFRNIDNKDSFLAAIAGCSNEEQEFIKDYYIALLHTIGVSGCRSSYFISFSSRYEVAERFAGKDGIVIVSWLSYGMAVNFQQVLAEISRMSWQGITCRLIGGRCILNRVRFH